MANEKINLGETIKRQRLISALTLNKLSAMSGVSVSHLSRIERGERYPSAYTLHKITEPLGFVESEIFASAGFLSSQPSPIVERSYSDKLDPFVNAILSQEPTEVQHAVFGIFAALKCMNKGISPKTFGGEKAFNSKQIRS